MCIYSLKSGHPRRKCTKKTVLIVIPENSLGQSEAIINQLEFKLHSRLLIAFMTDIALWVFDCFLRLIAPCDKRRVGYGQPSNQVTERYVCTMCLSAFSGGVQLKAPAICINNLFKPFSIQLKCESYLVKFSLCSENSR